jgi:hypothetical protein
VLWRCRARLVSPVAGWGSVMTESGYEILQMVVKLKVVSKQGAVMTESAQPDSTVVTTIPYGTRMGIVRARVCVCTAHTHTHTHTSAHVDAYNTFACFVSTLVSV